MKAVEGIEHNHAKRRGCGSLFAISMHVKILVIWPAIDQSMDQMRVTMKSKNYRLIILENLDEPLVRDAVGMLARMFKRHQIDHIDEADFKFR